MQHFSDIPQARALAFSANGGLFAFGGNDGRVHIHRIDHTCSTLVRDRGSLRNPIQEFSFCAGVARLAFGEGFASKRRLSARLPSRKLRDRQSAKVTLLAVGLQNGSIRVVDMDKGEVIVVLEDHRRCITSLGFNKNGSLILASTSQDGSCKFWDLWDDGNMFSTLRDTQLDGKAGCHSCAWAPDSLSICVTAGPQNATVWSAKTFAIEGRLRGHKHMVTCCDFSPDNTLIATASMDTSVIIWERRSCRPIRQLWHMGYRPSLIYLGGANGHHVTKVNFSRDNVHLVTVCDDKKTRLWDLDSGSAVEPEMSFTTEIFGGGDVRFSDAQLNPTSELLVMSCVDQHESFFAVAKVPVRRDLLMHYCRSSVRQRLSREEIFQLQLPQIMKRYLCYEHNIEK